MKRCVLPLRRKQNIKAMELVITPIAGLMWLLD